MSYQSIRENVMSHLTQMTHVAQSNIQTFINFLAPASSPVCVPIIELAQINKNSVRFDDQTLLTPVWIPDIRKCQREQDLLEFEVEELGEEVSEEESGESGESDDEYGDGGIDILEQEEEERRRRISYQDPLRRKDFAGSEYHTRIS